MDRYSLLSSDFCSLHRFSPSPFSFDVPIFIFGACLSIFHIWLFTQSIIDAKTQKKIAKWNFLVHPRKWKYLQLCLGVFPVAVPISVDESSLYFLWLFNCILFSIISIPTQNITTVRIRTHMSDNKFNYILLWFKNLFWRWLNLVISIAVWWNLFPALIRSVLGTYYSDISL